MNSVDDVVNGLHKFDIIADLLDQKFRQMCMAIIVKETYCTISLYVGNVVVLGLTSQMWMFNEISLVRNGVTFNLFKLYGFLILFL